MKRHLILLITTFISVVASHAQTTNLIIRTQQIINYLERKSYDSAYLYFSHLLQRQLSADELETIWEGLIDKYDTLSTIHETTITPKDSLWISETTIDFVKKSFKFHLSFSSDGLVQGIFFKDTNVPYTPPDYVNPLNFYELKLNIAAKGISNEGILSVPVTQGKSPLVIIVGGSGPTDMDGTIGANKPYKDLAWALASKGISVYRYNKRTVNQSNITKDKIEQFGLDEEYTDDLISIVNYLSKYDKINERQIYILGHSQGGFMLPYFAKRLGNKVKGYISVAGNVTTISEMLSYQFNYLKGLTSDSAVIKIYDEQIAKAEYMKKNMYNKNALKDSLIQGLTLYYLKDMEQHSPARYIHLMNNKPFLLIQGERDYQVTVSELHLWEKALHSACCVNVKMFEKLNHIMQEGSGKPGPAEYMNQSNIPEYLPSFVAEWVISQIKN